MLWKHNLETRQTVQLTRATVDCPDMKMNDFISSKIYIKSECDSCPIPVTLVHSKHLQRNHQNPMLLMVYGCYGENLEPEFRAEHLPLLRRGWVIAMCHVRGGGEMGNLWHHAATGKNKSKSFIDFESCAQGLIDLGYTQSSLLAARGVSAGGLVVAAAANRRPELFGALLLRVPFVDVLTTMLDETLPLTVHEREEWGDPLQSEEDFLNIQSYCPYANVQSKFPPTLLVAAGRDNIVPAWQPAKFMAKLRQNNPSNNLTLLTTDLEAGHTNTGDIMKHRAYEYSFLLHVLDLKS
eukprot:m.200610 g.200610  ORF g.200610 m.200610 type:complete len:295 (-) comp25946_c1_seq5:699-1583(-)